MVIHIFHDILKIQEVTNQTEFLSVKFKMPEVTEFQLFKVGFKNASCFTDFSVFLFSVS
uniref:Uncharacterized protein n=1 Tax=Amphimedon queenslandica TaxID=400682 RepID=A0A1X7VIS2_AMPQE